MEGAPRTKLLVLACCSVLLINNSLLWRGPFLSLVCTCPSRFTGIDNPKFQGASYSTLQQVDRLYVGVGEFHFYQCCLVAICISGSVVLATNWWCYKLFIGNPTYCWQEAIDGPRLRTWRGHNGTVVIHQLFRTTSEYMQFADSDHLFRSTLISLAVATPRSQKLCVGSR